jgi:hypothetical protein
MALTEPNFEDVQASNQSFAALAISAGSFPLAVTEAASRGAVACPWLRDVSLR